MMLDMKDMTPEQIEAYNKTIAPGLQAMTTQLIICWTNRNKGVLRVPVKEIDGAGQYIMTMQLDQEKQEFIFRTEKKQ